MGGGGVVGGEGAYLGSTTIFFLLLCTSLVVSFFTLWHERVRGNPSTPLKKMPLN